MVILLTRHGALAFDNAKRIGLLVRVKCEKTLGVRRPGLAHVYYYCIFCRTPLRGLFGGVSIFKDNNLCTIREQTAR